MALKNASLLSDDALNKVVGGLDITNEFGDGSVFKIGYTNQDYIYTFSAANLGIVCAEAQKVLDANPNATQDEIDALLMPVLEGIPGLLTPIK